MNFEDLKVQLMDRYELNEILDILVDSGVQEEEVLDCMEELIVDRIELFTEGGRYVEVTPMDVWCDDEPVEDDA